MKIGDRVLSRFNSSVLGTIIDVSRSAVPDNFRVQWDTPLTYLGYRGQETHQESWEWGFFLELVD